MNERPLKVGIVAGELSGDIIAADLIQAIQQHYPQAQFEGIAGPRMQALGCRSLFPMERLSVMGLTEVLGRLRELIGIRKQLVQHFTNNPPDVFIGVDAPDFNLTLEGKLKQTGIPSVHYVSPSVWAWRQGRMKKIARSVNLMLTLFPFEASFYERVGLPVRFVGHPLADAIPMQPNQQTARQALNLPADAPLIALLPGSRGNEVKRLGKLMLQTARWCAQYDKDLQFVAPMATDKTRALFEAQLQDVGDHIHVHIIDGHSREVMQAADAVLLASGTATLEAALMKRPMVVCYRLSAMTHWLMRRMVKVAHVALPNLLAGRELVPEFIQDEATPEKMGAALLHYLQDEKQARETVQAFYDIHQQLKQNAGEKAAAAVLELIASSPAIQ